MVARWGVYAIQEDLAGEMNHAQCDVVDWTAERGTICCHREARLRQEVWGALVSNRLMDG